MNTTYKGFKVQITKIANETKSKDGECREVLMESMAELGYAVMLYADHLTPKQMKKLGVLVKRTVWSIKNLPETTMDY